MGPRPPTGNPGSATVDDDDFPNGEKEVVFDKLNARKVFGKEDQKRLISGGKSAADKFDAHLQKNGLLSQMSMCHLTMA